MADASKLGLIIGACLIAIIVIGIIVVAYLLELPMYVTRDVAHDILISNDWNEVQPTSPMKIVRKFQSVELQIDGAYVTSKAGDHNLYLSDGTIISPQVQISDSDGMWYELEGGKYTVQPRTDGTDVMDIGTAGFGVSGGELPKDKTYRSIRIKSSVPFRCKSVMWQNYNLK